MPKNKGAGGKHKKHGKKDQTENIAKRELLFKEDGQEYVQVTKMLGAGHLEVICMDGIKRLGHIRGKMHKKVWISLGDVLLVGLRDYQDSKVDIIHKYNPNEIRSLKSMDEISFIFTENMNENENNEEDENPYTFEEVDLDKL